MRNILSSAVRSFLHLDTNVMQLKINEHSDDTSSYQPFEDGEMTIHLFPIHGI